VIGATLVVEGAELVVVVVHGGGGGGGGTVVQSVPGRGAARADRANRGKAATTDWVKCMMTERVEKRQQSTDRCCK